MEYLAPTLKEIYALTLELAEKIATSRYRIDIIVGISRGGWMPARLLSDFFGNTFVASMKIEFYSGINERGSYPVITQTVSADVSRKNLLLVDDVADSGKSLEVGLAYLRGLKATEVRSATIHYKPDSKPRPDYYVKKTKAWIIYPWEVRETLKKLGDEELEKATKVLVESGSMTRDELERMLELRDNYGNASQDS